MARGKSRRQDTHYKEDVLGRYKEQIRELRATNRSLIKENKRLKKQLNIIITEHYDLALEEELDEIYIRTENKPSLTCRSKECTSHDVLVIETPIKFIYECNECGYRFTRNRSKNNEGT